MTNFFIDSQRYRARHGQKRRQRSRSEGYESSVSFSSCSSDESVPEADCSVDLKFIRHSDQRESNGAQHRETAQTAAITIDANVQATNGASPDTSSLEPTEQATLVHSAASPPYHLDSVCAVPYSDGVQTTTVTVQTQPTNRAEVAIQVNGQVVTSDISIQVEEPPKGSTGTTTMEYANAVIQTNTVPAYAEVAVQVEELPQRSTSTKLEVAVDTSDLPSIVAQYAERVVQTQESVTSAQIAEAPAVERLDEPSGDMDDDESLYGSLPSTHDVVEPNIVSITDAGDARNDGHSLSHGVEIDAEMASQDPLPAAGADSMERAWILERQEMQSRIDALVGENVRLKAEMQTTLCTSCYRFLSDATGSEQAPQMLTGPSGTVGWENPFGFGQGITPGGVNQGTVLTNTMVTFDDGSQSAYSEPFSGDHQGIFYQGGSDAMTMIDNGTHPAFGLGTAQNMGYPDPSSQTSFSSTYGGQVVPFSYNGMPNFGSTSTPTQLHDQQFQYIGQMPHAEQESHQYVFPNSSTISEPAGGPIPHMGFDFAMPYTSTPVIASTSTSVDTTTQAQPETERSLQETANAIMALLMLDSSPENTANEVPPLGEEHNGSLSTVTDRVFARLPKRVMNRNNGGAQSPAPAVHFSLASSSLAGALGDVSNMRDVATTAVPPVPTTNGENRHGPQSTITDRVFARLPKRASKLNEGSAQSRTQGVHSNHTSDAVLPRAGPSSEVQQIDLDTREFTSGDDEEDRVSLCASEDDELEGVYIPRFEGQTQVVADESSNDAPEFETREMNASGHLSQSSDSDVEYRDELYWEMEAQAALELEAEKDRQERVEREWEENGM